MNLIFGCLGISFAIISTSILTHEPQVTVAGREASIAVEGEQYSHRPNRYGAYPRFRIEQKGQPQAPKPLDQWPMECEGAATRLDFAVVNTRKLEGAYLILIARLGTGEFSSSLNQARLSGVEEYVRRTGSDLKYVLAQGSRVKGLGRLEIYVGGKLADIMPLRKNAKGYCIPGRDGG
ncbi:MAG TPA: hypothetical protein VKC61_19685 [Pyrinomonadaceae bacterium]|nr:hypothetical protein [Pyrinomonadaceae bacterium]